MQLIKHSTRDINEALRNNSKRLYLVKKTNIGGVDLVIKYRVTHTRKQKGVQQVYINKQGDSVWEPTTDGQLQHI